MKSGSRRARRPRNSQPQEQNEPPFFSKAGHAPETQGSQPFFQTKLTVGQPGDPYEQEADTVAKRVVDQKQGGAPAVQEKGISSIQRLATPEEEKMPGTNDERMKEDKAIQEKPEEEEPVQKMEAPAEEKEVQTKPEEEEVQAKPEEEEPVQKMEAPAEEEEVQAKAEEEEVQAKPEEEEPVQKMEGPVEEEEVQAKAKEEEVQAKPEEEEPGQKMEAPAEEEEVQAKAEEEEPVQAKPATHTAQPAARPSVSQQISQQQGKGRAFSGPARANMENAFGADFQAVNIHADPDAVALNQQLGAQAFTHGQDIYFNAGKYRPETSQGKELLAHELTHVLQQNGVRKKRVQRKEDGVTKAEREAAEAQQIIERIKTDYDIDVHADSGVAAIAKGYPMVPQVVLDALKAKNCDYGTLVNLEKVLAHFAPIPEVEQDKPAPAAGDKK